MKMQADFEALQAKAKECNVTVRELMVVIMNELERRASKSQTKD